LGNKESCRQYDQKYLLINTATVKREAISVELTDFKKTQLYAYYNQKYTHIDKMTGSLNLTNEFMKHRKTGESNRYIDFGDRDFCHYEM